MTHRFGFSAQPFLRAASVTCALVLATASLTACGDDEESATPFASEEGCNPISGAADCLFPFPSDVFLVDGEVQVSDAAIPVGNGGAIDYASVTGTMDGYSTYTPIFVYFPEVLSTEALTFHTDDVNTTLSPESTTIILNADDGTPVLHFAELDARVSAEVARTVQIRLLEPLEPATRYIVAMQGLETTEGTPVAPLEGFDALRSGNVVGELSDLSAHMQTNVLAPLETFGVDSDELQVAWDFTTRSNESARGDVLSMIDQTRAWLESNDPTISNVVVREGDDLNEEEAPDLRRVIEATMNVPLFLTSDEPGASLTRDAQGLPVAESVAEVPILILIPQSVAGDDEAPVIQFGHGFFGDTEEMTSSFFDEFLDGYGHIGIGLNWWGLSSDDLGAVAGAITSSPADTFLIVERLKQSFVNHYVLSYVVQNGLATEAFMLDDEADDAPFTDGSTLSFYGISLGHILGSTAVSVSDQLTRAVFSVGGGPLSFAMSRSAPFSALLGLLSSQLSAPVDIQKFIALSSLQLEAVDPMSYTDLLRENTLFDPPVEREILAQVGVGDSFVPLLASTMWTTAANISVITPSPVTVPIVTEISAPTMDDGVVFFDFGLEEPLPGTFSVIPPSDATIHSGVRESTAGQEQVDVFVRTGEITQTCDGVCDPE